MSSGFYSIVQFMPNPDRREGINVGILLFETGQNHFNFVLTRPVRRIRALFRDVSEADIASESVRFYNTVMAEQFSELDDLTSFCVTQRGHMRCTDPEYVSVPHPQDFSRVLQELAQRLVLDGI